MLVQFGCFHRPLGLVSRRSYQHFISHPLQGLMTGQVNPTMTVSVIDQKDRYQKVTDDISFMIDLGVYEKKNSLLRNPG